MPLFYSIGARTGGKIFFNAMGELPLPNLPRPLGGSFCPAILPKPPGTEGAAVFS